MPKATLLITALLLFWTSIGAADDAAPDRRNAKPEQFERPFLIEFSGDIDWQLSKYFRSKIELAKSQRADLVVIEIDSPGGLKTESLNIAELIRDIDWAYTVAYVPKEAFSGAALVTFGCDEVIVGELARLGDIGVIQYDPALFAFRFAPEKIQSVLIRQARDLASSKGRSPDLAEAMIDKDYAVYFRKNESGKLQFQGQKIDDESPGGDWKLVTESKKGFLTINGARAKKFELAQSFASNRDEVAKKFGLGETDFRVVKHTTTDTIVYYLNHPLVTGLLILVGLIAFFAELSAPGIGFGGLLAGLCAALFFWSRFLGGTSTWLEIVLFAAGNPHAQFRDRCRRDGDWHGHSR